MVLVLDKERCRALRIMQQFAEDKFDFGAYITTAGVAEVALNLLEEIEEKTHLLKWCEDPKCQYQTGKLGEKKPDMPIEPTPIPPHVLIPPAAQVHSAAAFFIQMAKSNSMPSVLVRVQDKEGTWEITAKKLV